MGTQGFRGISTSGTERLWELLPRRKGAGGGDQLCGQFVRWSWLVAVVVGVSQGVSHRASCWVGWWVTGWTLTQSVD